MGPVKFVFHDNRLVKVGNCFQRIHSDAGVIGKGGPVNKPALSIGLSNSIHILVPGRKVRASAGMRTYQQQWRPVSQWLLSPRGFGSNPILKSSLDSIICRFRLQILIENRAVPFLVPSCTVADVPCVPPDNAC